MTTILVADDDPDFTSIMQMILESRGYEVVAVSNGEKALAAMRGQKPDLALLDVMMTYTLEGLDVARKMAQDDNLKDVPIIMVTSLAGAREQLTLPSDEYIPVKDWIHKPIDPDALLGIITRILGTE